MNLFYIGLKEYSMINVSSLLGQPAVKEYMLTNVFYIGLKEYLMINLSSLLGQPAVKEYSLMNVFYFGPKDYLMINLHWLKEYMLMHVLYIGLKEYLTINLSSLLGQPAVTTWPWNWYVLINFHWLKEFLLRNVLYFGLEEHLTFHPSPPARATSSYDEALERVLLQAWATSFPGLQVCQALGRAKGSTCIWYSGTDFWMPVRSYPTLLWPPLWWVLVSCRWHPYWRSEEAWPYAARQEGFLDRNCLP